MINEKGFLSAKLLIILGFVLLLLAGGGGFVYIKFLTPYTNAADQPQKVKKSRKTTNADNLPGPVFDLDDFIVNLAGDSGRRYLKTTIKLELSDEALKDELAIRMPDIRDNILVLLSSKSYNDIADVSGKIRLRTEIINRINNTLTTGEILKVYFTEFIIQ